MLLQTEDIFSPNLLKTAKMGYTVAALATGHRSVGSQYDKNRLRKA